jgi:hypothetical protein
MHAVDFMKLWALVSRRGTSAGQRHIPRAPASMSLLDRPSGHYTCVYLLIMHGRR